MKPHTPAPPILFSKTSTLAKGLLTTASAFLLCLCAHADTEDPVSQPMSGSNYLPINGQAYHLQVANVNESPENELLMATVDGWLRCLDTQTETELWATEVGSFPLNLATADMDGDGQMEIFYSGADGHASCFNSDGTLRWATDFYFGVYTMQMLKIDGQTYFAVGCRDRYTYLLDSNGQLLYQLDEESSRIFAADTNNDGNDEAILCQGEELGIVSFSFDGAEWGHTFLREMSPLLNTLNQDDMPYSLVIGDVIGDSAEELVIGNGWIELGGTTQSVNVQNLDCTTTLASTTGIPTNNTSHDRYRRNDFFGNTTPILADVLGDEDGDLIDENPGLEILAVSAGSLRVFNLRNPDSYLVVDHLDRDTEAYGPVRHTYPDPEDPKYEKYLLTPWEPEYRYITYSATAFSTAALDGRTLYLGSSNCGDFMIYRINLDDPDWFQQFHDLGRSGNQKAIEDNLMALRDEVLAFTPDSAMQDAALSYGPYRNQIHHTSPSQTQDVIDNMQANYPYYLPGGEYFMEHVSQVWSGFGNSYTIPQMQAELAEWEAAGLKVLLGCAQATGLFCENADGTWTDADVLADAAIAAAPTMLQGFASAEDGEHYRISISDSALWRGNSFFYRDFHPPLADKAVELGVERFYDEKGIWWLTFIARDEIFDFVFAGNSWQATFGTTEDSNNESPNLNLMALFGLRQSGLLQNFIAFNITDDFRVASDRFEWAYFRHGSPHFRKMVTWTTLGASGVHNRNKDFWRDPDLGENVLTQVAQESSDIYFHLLGKGILWSPKPSEMAGVCPVGFLFHHGSPYFPATTNGKSYTPEVPELSQAAFNHMGELFALAPTPEFSLEKLLFDKDIQGHNNIPATPWGPVVLTPFQTGTESTPGVQSWWHTDGVYIWKDPANKMLGQDAYNAVLADLQAHVGSLPLRASWSGDNRVFFHTINPEFDKELYRSVVVDADFITPHDKVVTIINQMPGDWEIRNALTGELLCPAGQTQFDLNVPAGSVVFLDTRPVQPNSILLSSSSLNVSEGGTATFQVKLAAAPRGGSTTVDVAPVITRFGINNFAVDSGATLTFDNNNWDQWQTVTIRTDWDTDETDNEMAIRVSAFGMSYQDVSAMHDDTGIALAVVPSTTELSVAEGQTNSLSIQLNRAPDSNQTVTLSRLSGDADISLQSPTTLTFTPTNWDTPQTVTFSADQDYDTKDKSAIYLADLPDGVSQELLVTEADDAVRILIDLGEATLQATGPQWNHLNSTEGSISDLHDLDGLSTGISIEAIDGFAVIDSIGVKPDYRAIARDDGFFVDATDSLGSFKLTGLQPERLYTLSYLGLSSVPEATSSYGTTADYFVAGPQNVYLINGLNQEIAAELPNLVPTDTHLDIDLQARWSDRNAVLGVMEINYTDTQGTPRRVLIDFGKPESTTSGNWNNLTDYTTNASLADLIDDQGNPTGLSLTLTDGFEDYRDDGQGVGTLYPTSAENDSFLLPGGELLDPVDYTAELASMRIGGINTSLRYSLTFFGSINESTAKLEVSVDNDSRTPGLKTITQENDKAIDHPVELNLMQADSNGEIEIVLAPEGASPEGILSVFKLGWTDELTQETTELLFDLGAPDRTTSSNWNNLTDVTLGAQLVNAIDSNGNATGIGVTITDAFAGIVDETDLHSTPYPEDAQVDGLTVFDDNTGILRLSGLSKSNPYDFTIFGSLERENCFLELSIGQSTATLFNTDNEDRVATLDGISTNGATTLDILGSVPAFVNRGTFGVIEIAYEPGAEIELSSNTLDVPEGDAQTFSMRLQSQPLTDITATITLTAGDSDISVQTPSLTFTPANWDQWQTISVAASHDPDELNDSATLTCELSNGDRQQVEVTTLDDDVAILVTPAVLSVSEDGTATFSVRLSKAPSGTVTINTNTTSGDDSISVFSGQTLEFNETNYDIWQTVTLSASADDDDENGLTIISLTGTDIPATVIAIEADSDRIEGALGIYNFPGIDPDDNIQTPHTEGNAAAHIHFSTTNVAGVLFEYGADESYSVADYPTSGTIDPNSYVSFEVALDPGWSAALHRLEFDFSSSTFGPSYGRVVALLDGQSVAQQDFLRTDTNAVIDFGDFAMADYQTLEFRIYGWAANPSADEAQRRMNFERIALYGHISQFNGTPLPLKLGQYLFTGSGTDGDVRTPHDELNAVSNLTFSPWAVQADGGNLAAVATEGDDALALAGWQNNNINLEGEYASFTLQSSSGHRLYLHHLDFDIKRASSNSPSAFRIDVLREGSLLESFDFNLFDTEQKHLAFHFADFAADENQPVEFRVHAWNGSQSIADSVVLDNIALWGYTTNTLPKVTAVDDGEILEAQEDGETIEITLIDATFAPTLTLANWSINNLPTGTAMGAVNRLSDTTAQIVLQGNRTVDYDTSRSAQVTCDPSELVGAPESPELLGARVLFTATDDPETLSMTNPSAITEGAEDGAIIEVMIDGGTFAPTLTPANWTLSSAPQGVGLGSLNRLDAHTVEVTLSGNTTEDYDADWTSLTLTLQPSETDDNNGGTPLSVNTGVTLSPIFEPEAISGFVTQPADGEVFLHWQLPTIPTFKEVLVLHSSSGPVNGEPVNGLTYAPGDVLGNATVLYKGHWRDFRHGGLSNQSTQYYAIFGHFEGGLYGPATLGNATLELTVGQYQFTGTGYTGDARTPHDEATAARGLQFSAVTVEPGPNALLQTHDIDADHRLAVRYWTDATSVDSSEYISFTVDTDDAHLFLASALSVTLTRNNGFAPSDFQIALHQDGQLVEAASYFFDDEGVPHLVTFDFADLQMNPGQSIEFRIHGWNGDPSRSTSRVFFDDLTVHGSATPVQPGTEWLASQGLPLTDAELHEDADLDGLSNIVEYALGLNPLQHEPAKLPQLALQSDNGSLVFRNNPESSRIHLIVEYSSDLVQWQVGYSTDPDIPDDGTISLDPDYTGTDLDGTPKTRALFSTSGQDHLFLRLNISED